MKHTFQKFKVELGPQGFTEVKPEVDIPTDSEFIERAEKINLGQIFKGN